MSDILIKNMEMPKSCITGKLPYYEYCPFFGDCSKASAKTERPSDCPFVEVPPHGDLIERSSVYKVLDDRIAFYNEAGDEYNACNIACIEGDIVVIPTIIEASKERV